MGRLDNFVRDYTRGLSQEDFRRLFDREASDAYRVLTREHEGPEPREKFHRLIHRAQRLFLGVSYKLTPVRRILFAGSILSFFLGLVSTGISIEREGVFSLYLDASPFWYAVSLTALMFLLALELVDKVRVRDELEVARQVQADLLPREAPLVPGYSFAHSYRTANEVGGDYYDFQPLPDGRLALVVGDASGHGMAAGLVMAIANATLRTALDIDPAGEQVAALLNRAICRTGDRRTFMSLFYGLLDPASGRLEHVLAGHPFPLLRRASGEILELGHGGLPLGIRDPLPVDPEEVTLAPGDLLMLYSDGLPEAVDGAGRAFGFDRLRQLLAAGGTPQEVHARVLAAFDAHLAGAPLLDDLTMVVVRREDEFLLEVEAEAEAVDGAQPPGGPAERS